jgi:hypothetical protein
MRGVLVGLVGLALLAPMPARAQIKFKVSPFVGVFFYDDGALAAARGQAEPEAAIKVDPGRLLGARLGVQFIDRLSIVGTIGFAKLEGGSESISDFELENVEGDLSVFDIGVGFTPFPDARLKVSGNLGIGGATTDFDIQDAESLTDVVVRVGIGVGYPLNNRVALRGDVGSVLEFCDEPQDERLTNCLEDASLAHIQVDGGVEFSFP